MRIKTLFLSVLLTLSAVLLSAQEEKINLRLCIFGDIQPQNMKTAMKEGMPYWYVQKLYKFASTLGVDAYLITGDVANYNNPAAYDLFRKLFDDSVKDVKNPPHWLPVMGNHDFWGTFWDKKSHDGLGKLPETRAARTEIFRKHLKLDSVNHHVVINGYDVIGFSIAGGMFIQLPQVKEVEAMIQKAVARDANKPIILFAHNHTGHTVRESGSNHNFYKMLSKYPQVIYFSGHTHIPLEDEMAIHQKDFTSVGTSALLNIEPFAQTKVLPYGEKHLGKNMLYVTISDKKVVIHRYQLRDCTEILDNGKPWTLQLPLTKETFAYTPEKRQKIAPVFPENAVLEAKPVFDKKKAFSGVAISGTAAKHPNIVRCYEIEIYEQSNGQWIYRDPVSRGKTVKNKLLLSSDFYKGKNFQKDTFSGTIPCKDKRFMSFPFEAGKTYRIDLRAQDCFGTPSARTLSTTISIPADR